MMKLKSSRIPITSRQNCIPVTTCCCWNSHCSQLNHHESLSKNAMLQLYPQLDMIPTEITINVSRAMSYTGLIWIHIRNHMFYNTQIIKIYGSTLGMDPIAVPTFIQWMVGKSESPVDTFWWGIPPTIYRCSTIHRWFIPLESHDI